MATLYRRPLPAEAIAFSSVEGRQLFAEALSAGGLDGYFPLAEQFHTQSDPAYCGLGSLVMALNALAIDPGRLWKGPWRWFGEEMLDCCVPLAQVRERGLTLNELACLARCNGAEVSLTRADPDNLNAFREALGLASRGTSRGGAVVIAGYDRQLLGQTGSGHFSPLGGYHAERDMALVLDVARFKYPPHWVSAEHLWNAMLSVDPATGRARGWLVLRSREQGLALGFSLTCQGGSWEAFAQHIEAVVAELAAAVDVAELARRLLPLAVNLEVRTPSTLVHEQALRAARSALRELALYTAVAQTVGSEKAEVVSLLLLACATSLAPELQAKVATLTGTFPPDSALDAELNNLRAQFAALRGKVADDDPMQSPAR